MRNLEVKVVKTLKDDRDRKNEGAQGQSQEKEIGLEIVDVLVLEIERKEDRGLAEERGRDHEKDMDMGREGQDLVSITIEGVAEVQGGMEEEGGEVVGNEEEESTTILDIAKESNTRRTWKTK